MKKKPVVHPGRLRSHVHSLALDRQVYIPLIRVKEGPTNYERGRKGTARGNMTHSKAGALIVNNSRSIDQDPVKRGVRQQSGASVYDRSNVQNPDLRNVGAFIGSDSGSCFQSPVRRGASQRCGTAVHTISKVHSPTIRDTIRRRAIVQSPVICGPVRRCDVVEVGLGK